MLYESSRRTRNAQSLLTLIPISEQQVNSLWLMIDIFVKWQLALIGSKRFWRHYMRSYSPSGTWTDTWLSSPHAKALLASVPLPIFGLHFPTYFMQGYRTAHAPLTNVCYSSEPWTSGALASTTPLSFAKRCLLMRDGAVYFLLFGRKQRQVRLRLYNELEMLLSHSLGRKSRDEAL